MTSIRDSRFPAVIPTDVTVSNIDLDQEEFIVDGTRLTERRSAELADRAERGAGRPSLASGVSPQIAFRVPQADKDRLAKIAKDLGRSPSDVAREAFDKGLELLVA
ncbi:MAG: ribbon-helix-helix domain-containing protein [Propionibacteriaceae bacterium]|jgi:hypothetical protein|nr:ribbon-helix-helix domain-containing protein [Propionibacteriaceae bacterium]